MIQPVLRQPVLVAVTRDCAVIRDCSKGIKVPRTAG
jgi:hypothetical protein